MRAAAHWAPRGEVVLVDARLEECGAGHIEGARSIPLAELKQRLSDLPADREEIADCRGTVSAPALSKRSAPSSAGAATLDSCAHYLTRESQSESGLQRK